MHRSNKGLFAPGNPWARRLAVVALLVLVVMVVALVVARHAFEVRDVRAVERSMSQLLGLEVRVRGPVTLQISLLPRVTLRDVHVHARDHAKHEALVAREMRLRLHPLPLLRRHWSIARLELNDVQLCLSAVRGSACDWRPALAAIDQVNGVNEFTIERLKVRCEGGPCARGIEREIALISGSLPAQRRMQLRVFAEDAQAPPLAALSAGSWSDFRANRPLPLRGALQSGDTVITFDGEIREPRALTGLSFEFDGRTDLGRWHEVALGEVRVHGRLAEATGGYRVRIDKGQWGTGTLSADVTAKRSSPDVTLEGTVAAHHVDLDPWVDAPTQGQAAGGFADVDARFTTSGESLDQWREHMRGSAQVAAGPAELPIDQVERWSKGFLKFVLAFPEEGATTRVNCMGGTFDLRGETAVTNQLRVDTVITRMRAIGSVSLRSGEIDFLVKPHLKKGPLKEAPVVAVTGKIERPVSRLATSDESAEAKPQFERLSAEPRDSQQPCR